MQVVQPGGQPDELVDAVNWDVPQVFYNVTALEIVEVVWELVVWEMVALWDSPVLALD